MAFIVGSPNLTAKYPGDIIVKITFWNIKIKILENYWEHPEVMIGASTVSIYYDSYFRNNIEEAEEF